MDVYAGGNNIFSVTDTKAIAQKLKIQTPNVPANASSSGEQGDVAWDANYIYICVSNNTWKRVAISTW
jgi:hypothetical protein